MNASAVILFFVIAVLAVVSGFPTVKDDEPSRPTKKDEPQIWEEPTEEVGPRFRRATCDLLSISLPIGSLNHSACAAHCLALRKGFKGGRCVDGICKCRR